MSRMASSAVIDFRDEEKQQENKYKVDPHKPWSRKKLIRLISRASTFNHHVVLSGSVASALN